MSLLPKIIDNQRRKLIDVLNTALPEYETVSIATGYWDLLGTKLIIDKLSSYKKIRLLIGREPLIPRHQVLEPEPDYPDKDFFYDLERLQPTQDLKLLVQEIKRFIADGILEIKVYRRAFLHAKCYVFGSYDSDKAIGIIGSSNFTKNGLTHNTELNALESDHRIVTFSPKTKEQEVGHLYWFDRLWDDEKTEDWNGSFTQLLEQSPVGDVLFSPYETYIRTLYELYKEELEEEDLDDSLKGTHELLAFQVKNVHALLRRLRKYKVAMLSDSVGLGKTYTAIEVIKQYITGEGGIRRVEVICPKSLKDQWTKELTTQGVLNLTPVTLQNPRELESKQKLDHIASVSLFVIDESHNLKNRAGKRFEQIVNWIRNNSKAHVLLLTATPINNQLNDITNQILLGTRGEAKIFKVTAVDKKQKQTVQLDFNQAIENLKKKMNQDLSRDGSIDYEYIRQIMSPILRAFVVRRTRQGIQKEYGNLTINGKEQCFPKVFPEVKKYGFKKEVVDKIRHLNVEGINLHDIYLLPTAMIVDKTKGLKHPLDQVDKINERIDKEHIDKISPVYFVHQIILLLGFLPYRWRMYQTKFYGKTRKQIRELRLASEEKKSLFLQISIYGILRTMFLKRLESSVSAVRSSVETYKRKLDVFEKGLDAGKIVSLKDLSNIEDRLGLGDEDVDPDDIVFEEEDVLDEVDAKKYNLDAIKNDLKKERILLEVLTQQLTILEEDDSKLKAFVDLLEDIHQKQPAGSKVLVFSYYADTINYLEGVLPKYTKLINLNSTGFISSKNRKSAEEFSGRFSPIAKQYDLPEGTQELNYLVSTDILSEGQNLQDCGILINYDLHWNPVRMIQRNGRINRLGTEYPNVYVYNIMPDSQLEEYLRLVNRLEGKINLIRNTIGTDTPVLDEEENPIEFTDSWKDVYSDDLQKRMEAIEQAEQEGDLLLSEDVYVSDLKVFHNDPDIEEVYRKNIYHMALGKWALMPQSKHQGGERPELLTLNRLYELEEMVSGHAFAAMSRNLQDFHAVTQLQALEWLKADKDDNKRVKDNISLDKVSILETNATKVDSYVGEDDVGAPLPQQKEILRIMYENHFDENEIENVRLSFQTTNVLDKQKIRKLIRSIMRDKKNNKPGLEQIRELVVVANRTLSEDEDKKELHGVKQVLFYVRDNS
ncbi:MAG: hypothetical protein KAJ18_09790 [Candidatus Omnitrophica bacterium]|nr:hypothetical protein [Candidatus Omnitrophota bacterium]